MAKTYFSIGSVVLLITIVALSGCDDEISPREKYTNYLIKDGAWSLSSAQVDDVEVHTYDGMSVLFTKTEYKAAYGGAIWLAKGKWSFGPGDDYRKLVLDDDLEMEITSINADHLIVSFTRTKDIHVCGNIQSTSSVHKFIFEHKAATDHHFYD